MVSTILLLPLKTVPTDIAHGHTDGLGAVSNNHTPTAETNEQRLDDLGRDWVVLGQETSDCAVLNKPCSEESTDESLWCLEYNPTMSYI